MNGQSSLDSIQPVSADSLASVRNDDQVKTLEIIGIEFETRFWHRGFPWFVPFAAELMLAKDRKVSQGFPI